MSREQPVRIAHIVGKMVGGGLEATVMNYYRQIDHRKIQYDFLIDEDSTLIPEAEIRKMGGGIILIPPYQKQLRYQRELYRLLKEKQYRMVYSHINTLSVFPLFAAWRARVPIRVAHNHSTAGKGEPGKNIMKYSLRPFAGLFPTHLCACSVFAGKWLFGSRAVRENRVTVWQNAVETGKFAFSQEIRRAVREELGFEEKYVIGHVGRFIHQKNHQFVLKIFAEVYKRRPDAILLLVGSGQLMPRIREAVNKAGLSKAVVFMGNRSDVDRLYQAMDVFLLPSFYEGLGMAAVEAQIAGLLVLCADTVPEEARICGNLHYLSLHAPVTKWADAALEYSSSLVRRDMSTDAQKAGYDIHKSAGLMTDWYLRLLKEP